MRPCPALSASPRAQIHARHRHRTKPGVARALLALATPLLALLLTVLLTSSLAGCAPRAPGPAQPGLSPTLAAAPATQADPMARAAALLAGDSEMFSDHTPHQAPENAPGQAALAALELLRGRTEPEARLLAAKALRQLGRLDEAVAECNRQILRTPRLAEAFVERGQSFSALGHGQRALEDFQAALVLEPKNIAALLAQGDAYFVLERPAEAEASYSRAIELAPARPLAWINRGVARDEQGRFQEAIADFTQALALDPAEASALANRGVSRSQAGDIPGMCVDYSRACALGQCRRLIDAQVMGYCLPR